MRAALEQELPRLRDILEDPDQRAAYLREASASHHRIFPRLAGYLGLTDDEADRLADLLAEQQLRVLEVRYRCALNPACDQFGFGSGYRQAADQELIDLLGPEKKKRFDDYREFTQERNQVTRLRGEMPDALRFNDDQAEKLATALGEERRRTVREWEQNGTAFAGLTTEFGYLLSRIVPGRRAATGRRTRIPRAAAKTGCRGAEREAARVLQQPAATVPRAAPRTPPIRGECGQTRQSLILTPTPCALRVRCWRGSSRARAAPSTSPRCAPRARARPCAAPRCFRPAPRCDPSPRTPSPASAR